MHADTFMYRNSILEATLGTRSRSSVDVGRLTLVAFLMGLGTCETEVIVGDQFEDLRRAQLARATGSAEGKMIVFKPHD